MKTVCYQTEVIQTPLPSTHPALTPFAYAGSSCRQPKVAIGRCHHLPLGEQFSKTFQTLTPVHEKNHTKNLFYANLTRSMYQWKAPPPQLQRRTGIAKVTFGLWWGSPQGGPLFLFRTTLKALSVWDHLSSHKYQVTLGSKRWVGAKGILKQKERPNLQVHGGAGSRDESTKGRNNWTPMGYIYWWSYLSIRSNIPGIIRAY